MNRAIARPNVTHLAKEIRRPTMVVAGRFDKVRPPAASEQFAQTIPDARFELIDAVHMMPAQAAGPLLALLNDFLGEQAASTVPAARQLRRSNAMKVKANGIAMNYQVDGPDGAPWLIFSNSLATNLTMWDDQARELKQAYRVLRYDQRGHGGTEATAGRYSFDLLMADVIALMDALAIKTGAFRRPVHGRGDRARPGGDSIPTGSTGSSSAIRRASRRPRARSNGRSASWSPRSKAWRRWSSPRSDAGFRRTCSRPIRRISTRSAG